jgi:hypothetical protein
MSDTIIEQQIAPIANHVNVSMPVMTIQEAVRRQEQMVKFVKEIMEEGKDFGTIPGTNTKPTLLKAGAEKLTTFFGLTPVFVDETAIEDFTDPDYPFFYYRRKCQLWKGNLMIAEASGSCNSREKKYRWRSASQTCPACGKETIIKGKAQYGGGWVCWMKKGGCGGKFADDAPEITSQQVGQVENPDVYDLANTVLKMADKRALVATTLLAVNASEFFTQDLEDMDVGADFVATEEKPKRKAKSAKKTKNNSKTAVGFRPDFLNEHGLAEKAALSALGPDIKHVNDWLKANAGKTLVDAEAEILAVVGKG